MRYTGWDALKDFLGALGPVLIAIPWFYDFDLRNKMRETSDMPASGRLSQLKKELQATLKEKVESPKIRDLVWTVAGLGSIFTSFLIALIHGLVG
jgi:hypothetical protein